MSIISVRINKELISPEKAKILLSEITEVISYSHLTSTFTLAICDKNKLNANWILNIYQYPSKEYHSFPYRNKLETLKDILIWES